MQIKGVWTDLSTKDKRQQEAVANPKYFKVFKKEILNEKVLSVERRGKNILIHISGGKTILIHMKMTGHLLYGKYKFHPSPTLPLARGGRRVGSWIPAETSSPLNDPYSRFVHVIFIFSNGKHLAFSDSRKFGKITLLDTKIAHNSKHLKDVGPDPLDKNFDVKKLKERLSRKPNGKIKTVLVDQSILAGIGNIYSDEILWRAGVHPERRVSSLKEKELKLIFMAIKETLTKGIGFGGDSISDYRNVDGLKGKFQLHHEAYGRTGEKCKKRGCKGIILRKVINGRSAHFCDTHQK